MSTGFAVGEVEVSTLLCTVLCSQVHFAALSLCHLGELDQSTEKGWELGSRHCTVLLISNFISSADRNTDGFSKNPFHFLWLLTQWIWGKDMEMRSNW